MTATDELRALLDERGVEWRDLGCDDTSWKSKSGILCKALLRHDRESLYVRVYGVTPSQAIDATLWRGTYRKVYLVETSDDLIDSWYPVAVYLHRESAEDCAEALRKEEDLIRHFARVSELKVVDG